MTTTTTIAKTARKGGDTVGKKDVLNSVLDQIKRQHGEGSIMWLGDNDQMDVSTIPTGSLSLDVALGVGGVPRGRIVEVFGPEASGKTTLALHMVAAAQKAGGVAAFIDAEHALDPTYAQAIGLDLDEVLISQPNSGEQALEITEKLVRSGALDIIVVDSVAALVPESEIAGNMGDAQVGLQARLMSQAMRKLSGAISQTNSILVFINQIRQTIGGSQWGPKTTTTGGLALKFYASVRLDVRRIGTIAEGDDKVGNETLVKVAKNKVAPPFKEAHFDIIFGKGIVYERDLIHAGVLSGDVKKKGAWFSYGDLQLGQGVTKSSEYLTENPEIAREIEIKVRNSAGLAVGETISTATPEVAEVDADVDADAEEAPKAKKATKAKKAAASA
jgi:recombination protein RecA